MRRERGRIRSGRERVVFQAPLGLRKLRPVIMRNKKLASKIEKVSGAARVLLGHFVHCK